MKTETGVDLQNRQQGNSKHRPMIMTGSKEGTDLFANHQTGLRNNNCHAINTYFAQVAIFCQGVIFCSEAYLTNKAIYSCFEFRATWLRMNCIIFSSPNIFRSSNAWPSPIKHKCFGLQKCGQLQWRPFIIAAKVHHLLHVRMHGSSIFIVAMISM